MSNQKPSPVTLPTPGQVLRSYKPNLTPLGERVTNIAAVVGTGALVAAGVALGLEAHKSAQELDKPSKEQVQTNMLRLTHADSLTTPLKLKSGVKVRLSPSIKNGNNADDTPDNIVDNLIPRGKTLDVNSSLPVGNGWLAFERPGTTTGNIETSAKNLIYVDADAIRNDPTTATLISNYRIIPLGQSDALSGSSHQPQDNNEGAYGPFQLPDGALESEVR